VLPVYTAGAHISVRTPAGPMRRYSLIGADENHPARYVIAVKREPDSRGGSASMHDDLMEGMELEIEPPENDFPLKKAPKYLLIAGGIGVTPIYGMARQLSAEAKDFSIIYCTTGPEETAYLDEMKAEFGARLKVHHDGGNPAKLYDFWDHFAEIKNMHVYCCGPRPLMEEIKSISGHWPEGRVNFEDFKPVEVVRPDDVAFEVKLARSGKKLTVPADRSILEAVRDSGIRTVSSCESGTCGTCKCGLIAGEPDHRDMVLMEDEKDRYIMICVSRAKSGRLVLDL
jgi:phthalate 4,5-dioxygenase reductase subunit